MANDYYCGAKMDQVIVVNIEKCLGCKSCELACALVHSKSKVLEEAVWLRLSRLVNSQFQSSADTARMRPVLGFARPELSGGKAIRHR